MQLLACLAQSQVTDLDEEALVNKGDSVLLGSP